MHPSSTRNNTPPPTRGLQYITPSTQLSSSYPSKAVTAPVGHSSARGHPALPTLVPGSQLPDRERTTPPLLSPSVQQLLHLADTAPTLPEPAEEPRGNTSSRGQRPRKKGDFSASANLTNDFNNTFTSTFKKTTSSSPTPSAPRAGAGTASAPPLAVTLRSYLDRESLYSQYNGNSPETRLEPYREVLGALGEAFPNYASLFEEIRTAYDAVIQEQARQIVSLHDRDTVGMLDSRKRNEDTLSLQRQVEQLEADLAAMRKEMEEREGKVQQQKDEEVAKRPLFDDKEEELDMAKRRVEELEKNSRGDLEKILLLINSVRECDAKIKSLEETVREMSEQLEELDDARRMAGEAQTELQKYKERFESFVPARDFDLMKEHLGAELTKFQNEARRLRRTAAARSTQVNVLNRKFLDLEAIKDNLLSNQKDKVLTPRPNWEKVKKELPSLKEHVKNDHCFPLDPEEGVETAADVAEQTEVSGPNTTVLQVEFLVDTIVSLTHKVQQLEAQVSQLKQEDTLPLENKEEKGKNNSKRRSVAELAAFESRKRPLLGAGVGATVPPHLRICGAVERVLINNDLRTKLIFDFFSELQQPVMEAASIEQVNTPLHFYHFLESEVLTNEEVRRYFSHPAQIAYNLMYDSLDAPSTNAALTLLEHTLMGSMPARIAVDSATLVSHAIADLESLSKEQQKTRLRRPAIAECMMPILELKEKKDIQELRSALGPEMSFDTISLINISNQFMRTLFLQECLANMKLYSDIVIGISKKSKSSNEEDEIVGEVDRVVSLKDVTDTIMEIEPKTPTVIIRELTEDAVTRGVEGALVTEDEKPSLIRLSDVMRVIGTAPILRKSPLSSHEDCTF